MDRTSLRNNLFIIPVENGRNIIYSPLHGAAFYASDTAATLSEAYIRGEEIIEDEENSPLVKHIRLLEEKQVFEPQSKTINTTSSLVVILSQMCNLACSYCYAQDARSKDVLPQDKLKTAIDYIFDNGSKKKHFSFIGGGEPTLTWDLLSWAITYIRSKDDGKQKAGIGITTNGTLLNDEKIDFLYKNDVRVGLSFEILPDVQGEQRCFADKKRRSFEVIDATIKKLVAKGVHISFRSTITKTNVKRLPEMVEFVIEHYPTLKRLHFEQVTSTDNDKTFYDDFIQHFIEARKLGAANGIDVYCSGANGLNHIKTRFCGGELCITPSGDIVACHRISSPEEEAFESFSYAKVEDEIISMNLDKKEAIEKFYNAKRDACSTCFAKWHCAGSCSMERTIYTEQMRDLKCYFTKELIKRLLIERIKTQTINKR